MPDSQEFFILNAYGRKVSVTKEYYDEYYLNIDINNSQATTTTPEEVNLDFHKGGNQAKSYAAD